MIFRAWPEVEQHLTHHLERCLLYDNVVAILTLTYYYRPCLTWKVIVHWKIIYIAKRTSAPQELNVCKTWLGEEYNTCTKLNGFMFRRKKNRLKVLDPNWLGILLAEICNHTDVYNREIDILFDWYIIWGSCHCHQHTSLQKRILMHMRKNKKESPSQRRCTSQSKYGITLANLLLCRY